MCFTKQQVLDLNTPDDNLSWTQHEDWPCHMKPKPSGQKASSQPGLPSITVTDSLVIKCVS